MSYNCPVCGSSIASWLVNKENFECPDCKTSLASNSKKAFKQSLVVAFIAWLTFLICMRQYTGSWGYAAVVSIEGGGILSAMLATLYYHFVVNIKVQTE
ncbi:hypothetical protein [Candidatus Venteria ishoeyi]|uniref:Uncharacterized protein n=2 Tax=Candidatus Venteria ishoeyi TaxID=1899563 RepID=A0A1H6FBD6_9GAMM|nr:hypothetical protein [Candidatus Venteria ishoeyi]SEH04748.1 Uncharacterised protein [Candidatus Venteria ishoeyi]SEH06639.1 Uncharacterised protein [Candidatus Venteria ishoeyi]